MRSKNRPTPNTRADVIDQNPLPDPGDPSASFYLLREIACQLADLNAGIQSLILTQREVSGKLDDIRANQGGGSGDI